MPEIFDFSGRSDSFYKFVVALTECFKDAAEGGKSKGDDLERQESEWKNLAAQNPEMSKEEKEKIIK